MSMVKIVPPGSQNFGEPPTQLVKVSERGLIGSDFKEFVKRANWKLAKAVNDIKLSPGEELVHNIALGASEFFGANRNADAFQAETCRKYHPTFVKHARAFRDHCFPADTPILMADRTRRPIKSVEIGERVATLNGPYPITAVMKSDYDGLGVRLKVSGIPTDMIATTDHPILILRRSQIHCSHKYNRLGFHRHRCPEFKTGFDNLKPQYVPAGSVKRGDYVLVPKPEHGHRSVSSEFARLVGWVASEGHLGSRGAIAFTFSAKNLADIASVEDCLRRNGLHVCSSLRKKCGLVQLAVCSKELHSKLSEYVVGIKNHKRLTAAILEWDKESLLEMLTAYIDGDGNSANGKRCGQLRIRSSSKQMLAMLSDIIRSLDVPVTINYDDAPGVMRSPTNGKLYMGNGSGVVAVNAHYSPLLTARTRKCVKRNSSRRPSRMFYDGFYLMKVLNCTSIELNETVYNLEVAGPNHYIAHEMLVHNCNTDKAKSYGVVKHSDYNEDMKRIELLIAMNGTKQAAEHNGGLVADKELELLHAGKDYPTSMACFPPGTPISLADGTELPIEEIEHGHQVITHTGNIGAAGHVSARDFVGDLVQFTIVGLPDKLCLTPNHKVWIRPHKAAKLTTCPVCQKEFKLLRAHMQISKDDAHKLAIGDLARYTEDWRPAENIVMGDWVRTPFDTTVEEAGDPLSAELLGYYLADGVIHHDFSQPENDTVTFYFRARSLDRLERINDILERSGYNTGKVLSANMGKRCKRLVVHDLKLIAWLEENGGIGDPGLRRISQRAMRWSPAIQLQLLNTTLDTAAHWRQTNQELCLDLVSRQLAFQLSTICWRNGIAALLHSPKPHPDFKRLAYRMVLNHWQLDKICCHVVPKQDKQATWDVSDEFWEKYGSACPPGKRFSAFTYVEDGFVYRRVHKVARVSYTGKVHNFSVSTDSSYVAAHIGVANCKVAYDVCAACGNKARNRSEYCRGEDEGGMCKRGGVKNRLCFVHEDGYVNHVLNPHPCFFDLSRVFRGADRISWTDGLVKAGSIIGIGGAELAEKQGVEMPEYMHDTAPWWPTRVEKLATELAQLERSIGGRLHTQYDNALTTEDLIETDWEGPGDRQQKLAALLLEKIALPVEGWLRVLHSPQQLWQTHDIEARLPGVYGRMIDDGSITKIAMELPAIAGNVSPILLRWANAYALAYSLAPQHVEFRTKQANFYGLLPPAVRREPLVKSAADSAEMMARGYALYKLAFLRALQDNDESFPLTCLLAVRQHYV